MSRIIVLVLFFFLVLSCARYAFASSDYVLPYPSAMPGSFFYKLDLFKEAVMKIWYFGDFGQAKFDLQMADKYLVEAKTLFEYKQYLLAENALLKSNIYFSEVKPNLLKAQKNGKPTQESMLNLKNAASKHIEELLMMESSTPVSFAWVPEKGKTTNIALHNEIDNAIQIRESE